MGINVTLWLSNIDFIGVRVLCCGCQFVTLMYSYGSLILQRTLCVCDSLNNAALSRFVALYHRLFRQLLINRQSDSNPLESMAAFIPFSYNFNFVMKFLFAMR